MKTMRNIASIFCQKSTSRRYC